MELCTRSLPGSQLSWFCAAPGIKAVPQEDNLRYFNVEIDGPGSSPYEGSMPSTARDVAECSAKAVPQHGAVQFQVANFG